jgi:hypothetical protein
VSYVQLGSSGRVDLSLNGREEQLCVWVSWCEHPKLTLIRRRSSFFDILCVAWCEHPNLNLDALVALLVRVSASGQDSLVIKPEVNDRKLADVKVKHNMDGATLQVSM